MATSYPKSFAGRPSDEAELLGQVNTPSFIAQVMVRKLLSGRQTEAARILDPCVGPYTFPLAMLESGLLKPGDSITCIDVDPKLLKLQNDQRDLDPTVVHSIVGDYLELPMNEQFDYAILNPPYVRQEWLDKKEHYKGIFRERYALKIPGTSNLYSYFISKVIEDLKPGGRFACIVYDAWQSTLYGRWIIKLIRSRCQSFSVETITGQPFRNRLIDAVVLYGTKAECGASIPYLRKSSSQQDLTRGPLADIEGFNRMPSCFHVRRGLRLKQADFFSCDLVDCGRIGATPFVKKVGLLKGCFSVPETHDEAALLIESREDKPQALAELRSRLAGAEKRPNDNVSVLTWYRERPDDWFCHQAAPHAPILFNYYIRNRPRHIYNPTRAYSDNFYGLTPREGIPAVAWLAALNSTAVCVEVMAHSRNQGSGLAKIQLYEYREAAVPDLQRCSAAEISEFHSLGLELVETPHLAKTSLRRIDELIAAIFADDTLSPSNLTELLFYYDKKARRPRGEI